MPKNKFLVPFILVCSLFFLWAFLHNMNPILIPHLKKACQLSDTQSSFIDSAVYLGYFLAAIPAGLFIHRWGYKNGIIFGLMLFALGSLLFIPAAIVREYWFFLGALFIAACGATFLETIANPYATLLGNPATAEQRLNFAQSFNGVGAFVAPLIGSKFIFSGIEHSNEELQQMSPDQLNAYLNSEAATVQLPYLVIGLVIIIVIILFAITKLPEIKEDDSAAHGTKFSLNVFKFSHVKWAMLSEFCYVGAQVGIGSFFIKFSKELMNLEEKPAGYWWGIAMIGFMAGRFAGTFFMSYIKPAKLLSLYAIINIALLAFALINHNQFSVYAVMAVPFFMSIMFPTIFALGIKGLGEETKIASSFLVMSIIGGGIFAPIMGYISDKTGSMQSAYIVPLICFVVILFFGLKGHKIKTISTIETHEKVLSGIGS
jgi:MFS transporter, FHS family, L-fucose permease